MIQQLKTNLNPMTTRTRFAPSPTGNVHIGNMRAAIFNWLFARAQKGKFLLRIEDTDLERSTPEAIRNLLNAMAWMGVEYDEEATYQTKNRPFHDEAVARMIAMNPPVAAARPPRDMASVGR
jgi:glutamyl-tRNA synthetase